MDDSKPWYASKTIWGSIIAILSGGFMLFGITITPDMMGPMAEALASIGAAIGSLVAVWGRVTATKRIGSGS